MSKLSLKISILVLLTVFVTGCTSTSVESRQPSLLDDVRLKMESGNCNYYNFNKAKTICTLKLKLKNNGLEPVQINGKFRFDISTYKYQVRYAQYKELEDEGWVTKNAQEVLGQYDGAVGTSDTRIDDEINPLRTYSFTVAVSVPTNSIIQGVEIKMDKSSEFASNSIRYLFLNICTYGDKSTIDSKFMQRGYVCKKGKAVNFRKE